MKMKSWLVSVAVLFAVGVLVNSSYARFGSGDIVGIWLMDEGSGDEMGDTSGNGNHGELVGAEWADGKFGSALEFDGTSHVAIPASASIDDFLDGFTYMIWVKPTAPHSSANTRIIERDWHNPTIQMGAADFYASIAVNADQANTHVRGGAWVQDEWSFVAATYDGSLLQLYVDGEMVNEKDVGTPDTGVNGTAQGAMWLGSWKAPGWDFTGVLDEAAVFSVPLSEEDILNIMDNGLEHVTAVSSPGKMAVTWGYVKDVK